MNLNQWQSRLESLDPSRIELGLERVKLVFKRLSPQISSKVILIGGTNGKGSTVAALEALFLAQGCTVGAYTSPHLQYFNERVRLQGKPVSDSELVSAFERVDAVRDGVELTYFEFTTLAAISLLALKAPDYLLFEVGLGGRLDAVNILDADIAVVTGVALDHTDWLGPDLESIGYEKAGIYRSAKPAIYASKNPPKSLLEKIDSVDARGIIRGQQLHVDQAGQGITYRVANAELEPVILKVPAANLPPESILAALAVYAWLGFELDAQVSEILSKVTVAGRYQKFRLGNTDCILDVAHNAQAANYLSQRLKNETGQKNESRQQKYSAIVGLMSDKALEDILSPMVGVVKDWYLVQPNLSRAASTVVIREVLISLNVNAEQIYEVGSLDKLSERLPSISAAVVFGSFYTVGEFLDCYGEKFE